MVPMRTGIQFEISKILYIASHITDMIQEKTLGILRDEAPQPDTHLHHLLLDLL